MLVQRSPDRVWIDGVAGFSPDEFASSVQGAQARILQSLGETLSYADLICYSAFAFRAQVHNELCPSAGHPACGYECLANGVRAIPYRLRILEVPPADTPAQARAAFEADTRRAVVESIDRGVPVHYGSEEDGLIVGYGDGGRRWWCLHPYHKAGQEEFWHDEASGFAGGSWPWGIAIWGERRPAEECASPRDLLAVALQQALQMWHTREREGYYLGEAAYAHWLGWLQSVERGEVADPQAGMLGNGWGLHVLVHSRRIAGPWLAHQGDGLGGAAGRHLRSAAEHYAHLARGCSAGLDSTWSLAPGPDGASRWTSAMRHDQIGRLEAARDHDRAAIAAIEHALEAL